MISKTLITWYNEHHRSLPWRNTTNPYHVWVSEIILQQTQVAQGLPYFNRFMEAFPTVKALATADEDAVLKLWQGLGYYSRARNMHFSAQYIQNELNGIFPKTFTEIKQLKGVGDYTAAAIASFCYLEKTPVVDGNVLRVIARYYGITEPIDNSKTIKYIRGICEELISDVAPDVFNQAIMEFGALQCKPNQPNCTGCPLKNSCWAFANQQQNILPIKEKSIKKRSRYFYYLLINDGENTFIKKREENDIWKGLYEFPLIENNQPLSEKQLHKYLDELGLSASAPSVVKKHLLSHQTLYGCSIECFPKHDGFEKKLQKSFGHLLKVKRNDIEQFAFPKLIERLLEDA